MSREKSPEVSQKPSDLWLSLGAMGLAVYGFVRLGADVVYTGWEKLDELRNPHPNNPTFPLDENGQRFFGIDMSYGRNLQGSINAYKNWTRFGSGQIDGLLDERQPKDVAPILNQIGRNFITEGSNLMQTSWLFRYTENKVYVDQGRNTLWIDDDSYDLNNRFEMNLAGAWMQSKLEQINLNLQISLAPKDADQGERPIAISDLEGDLQSLTWLKRSKAPISMDDNTFQFFPREHMVKTARVLQAVSGLGLDLPSKINWCNGCFKGGEGRTISEDEDGKAKVTREKGIVGGQITSWLFSQNIVLESDNLSNGVAHELGHYMAGKNDYLRLYRDIRGYSGLAESFRDRLKYVTDYAMLNEGEDFADTFSDYMMKGSTFRALLSELQFSSPEDWAVLQAKYNFIKNVVFRGEEFDADGKKRVPILEEMEEEFSGISWSVKDRSLVIKPTPASWPNRRYVMKNIPILLDGKIEYFNVGVGYDPKSDAYSVSLSVLRGDIRPLPKELVLLPTPGKDRVLVEVKETSNKDVRQKIETGISPQNKLNLGSEGPIDLQLEVKSLTPIEVGQERNIRINGWRWIGESTEGGYVDVPIFLGESVLRVTDGHPVLIGSGPHLGSDDKGETKFWIVSAKDREGNLQSGAIQDRYIGERAGTQIQ